MILRCEVGVKLRCEKVRKGEVPQFRSKAEGRGKGRLRSSQEAPRSPQEAPRRPQETPRAGQDGSKLSKIAPRGSQKAPKTHKIAEVDESQRPCPKSQNEKRRAGGGDAPWGKSIRRPPRRGESTACQTPRRNAKISASYCISSLAEFSDLPIVPPGGLRIPPGRPKKRIPAVLFRSKF